MWGSSSSVPPAFHVQTAGVTFQLSPRRAVGGMSGLTLRARSRFLVNENITESGGVDVPIRAIESLDASGFESVSMLDHQSKILGLCFQGAVPVARCRFGSWPGRSWCRCRSLWFCFFSVESNSGRSMGTDGSSLAVSVAIQGVSY